MSNWLAKDASQTGAAARATRFIAPGLRTLVIVAGLVSALFRPAGASDEPNVLLILIDALRADHLGCYGYARGTSPAIDDLSERAVLFEKARSQASWTKPSIPSLLTGLYPIQHKVSMGMTERAIRQSSDVLADEHVTLAEALKARGYATAAFVENTQISSSMGFAQGFDLYSENLGDAKAIGASFIKWFESRPRRPFFAYVHFLDPHWPYTPPPPYDEFPRPEGTTVDFNNVNWKYFEREVQSGEIVLTPEDLAAVQSLYDGEIRYADSVIGHMLDALQKGDAYENTIIVITSDHGEAFMEHGTVGHGDAPYEEVLRVPLLVRSPGINPGRITDQVQTIDIMPTILDLVGAAIPGDVAGRSLRPLMRGSPMAAVPTFSDHRPDGAYGNITQSVCDGRYKLIRTFRVEGVNLADKPAWDPPEIQRGTWLEIEGVSRDDGRFLALEIEPQEPMEEVRVSGMIEAVAEDNKSFRLLGFPCRLSPSTRFQNSSGDRLRNGEVIEGLWAQVKGRWSQDGTFDVTRVKFLDEQKSEVKAPVREVDRTDDDSMLITLAGLLVDVDEDTEFEGEWPGWKSDADGSQNRAEESPEAVAERRLVALELFDLDTDPREQSDLSEREPERAQRLYERLDEWERTHARDQAAPQLQLDEATLERLRSLGYLE